MGVIRIDVVLEGKTRKLPAKALVDTGASLSVIPRSIAQRLDLVPFKSYSVELADGRIRKLPVATAGIRVNGRSAPASVLIAPKGEVLLGAETMELLGITVDPRHRRLKLARRFVIKAA